MTCDDADDNVPVVSVSCQLATVGCVSVTFVYCVDTVRDTATVAMECE